MKPQDRARELRSFIEKAVISLSDEDALDAVELFPHWSSDTSIQYTMNVDRVLYNDILYKCIQTHTAQSDRTPDTAVSLWARVLIPDPEIIYDWEQPDSTNPYMTGDKVRHNGKIWISIQDYNVFEPGVAGWEEVNE